MYVRKMLPFKGIVGFVKETVLKNFVKLMEKHL